MMILALETSRKQASLVIGQGKSKKTYELNAQQTQGCDLVPLLEDSLMKEGINATEIKTIALHVGPGSTTGLRMGVALVQGFSLVMPEVEVHAIPLESLGCAQLKSLENFSGQSAALLANAYGGMLFMQKYKKTSSWNLDGDLEMVPVEMADTLDDHELILSDLGDLRHKRKWPEHWQWVDAPFPHAELVYRVSLETQEFLLPVEELDVRYLKPSSAELNWKST